MRISDWSSDVCSSDLTGHRDQAHAQSACVKPLHGILPRRRARSASTLMTAAGALWRARDGRTVHYVSGRTTKAVRSWADADATALEGPSQREEPTLHTASASTTDSKTEPHGVGRG